MMNSSVPINPRTFTFKKGLRFAKRKADTAFYVVFKPLYEASRRIRRKRFYAADKDREIVLFLNAEAGLTPFYSAHAILARTLNESGKATLFLSCDGILPKCSIKPQTTLSVEGWSAACMSCRHGMLRGGSKYNLPDIAIDSVIIEEDLKSISSIIAKNVHAPWTAVFDGIPFGGLALGETLREKKKLDTSELNDADRADLMGVLRTALIVYFAIGKILRDHNIARIVYYGAYATLLPVVLLARKIGIPTTQIEHGYNRDVDMRLINLRPKPVHEQQLEQHAIWPRYCNIPIPPRTVDMIADSSLYRLQNHGGKSLHSSNWSLNAENLIDELGLSRARKTLVAYSSSADEHVAAHFILDSLGLPGEPTQPFVDSLDWMKSLIAWAEPRKDFQLILRLHPRLAQGAGEESSEYRNLRKELVTIPDNVRIIWPLDNVSSYNLGEIADTVLVAWTTIALEFARFGAPVVAAFRNRGSFPVGGFIDFSPDREGYFNAILASLEKAPSWDHVLEAFRWTHFLFLSPTIDLSDIVPADNFTSLPAWRTPNERNQIVRSLTAGDDVSSHTMQNLDRTERAFTLEREAIRNALARFLIFMLTGKDHPGEHFETLESLPDNGVTILFQNVRFRRHSPLVYRLAKLWLDQASI
jgi:hypothetical protein